jgi:hypothetical protein
MSTNDISMLDTFTTAYNEPAQGGDGLLRIHWYNGEPKMKTPGAFFVEAGKLEALGIEAPGAPWKPETRTFEDGGSKDGYGTPALKVMAIGARQQDIIIGDDGALTWLEGRTEKGNRPEKWSIFVEMLCVVQGFQHGPVVWSSRRIKSSMGILAGVLGAYRRELLDEVKKARRNPKIPAWAFWLPVRGAVDAKGAVIYEQTKGKPVTPPTLVLPDGDAMARASALFVGSELLSYGEAIRGEYDTWLNTKPGDARVAAPAEPAHNSVQEMEPDHALPF